MTKSFDKSALVLYNLWHILLSEKIYEKIFQPFGCGNTSRVYRGGLGLLFELTSCSNSAGGSSGEGSSSVQTSGGAGESSGGNTGGGTSVTPTPPQQGIYANLSNFAEVVSSLTEDSTIIMTGQLTASDLSYATIYVAVANSTYKINLDLTGVEGLDSLPICAFDDCTMLSGISLPNTVTSIGERAFYHCSSLASVNIPYGVTSIGERAFEYCRSLETITIPDSVTSIGEQAFMNCTALVSVNMSNRIATISREAFIGCSSLASITIPASVTAIYDYAFDGCTSLTSITIPASVTTIGSCAFSNSSKLTEINVNSENAKYSSIEGVLFNKDKSQLICYPAGKSGNPYVIPGSVTGIESCAFYGCTSLSSITFSDASNWYRSQWSGKSGGTKTDVTNATANVGYFTDTYKSYNWYKL